MAMLETSPGAIPLATLLILMFMMFPPCKPVHHKIGLYQEQISQDQYFGHYFERFCSQSQFASPAFA